MYKEILNQVPSGYYDRGVKSNPFQWIWHSWKWYSLKSFLVNFSGEVLDVGCADGHLTSKIKELLPTVNLTGVDLHKRSINYAKKKWPQINFVIADARELPFGDREFDNIICVETLEHVPENEKALDEIYRVLVKDGTLVVCQDTDSFLFNFIWFFWVRWKGKVWEGAHINCVKPDKLEKLLKKHKFRIVDKKFSHLGLEVTIKARKV
ncbi:MAG: class I SAM-dependent methyltransferase [Candidatus Curtissbacteria bacterium]|nr:class I SAM-dependent methyltransferase [Candidatus Curtissbacteria bacterium]